MEEFVEDMIKLKDRCVTIHQPSMKISKSHKISNIDLLKHYRINFNKRIIMENSYVSKSFGFVE